MAEESDQGILESEKKDSAPVPAEVQKKRKGFLSRVWNGIFRVHGDDFEKRLQHISREEASVLLRMKKRSLTWRRMTRYLIILSVFSEVIAVGYAIATTRTLDMDWKTRAFRVLPVFVLPAIASISYISIMSFTKMRDRRDQKTLERLRAERQAKIDELKERTNYYTTQQLIQRYDPDPAAKAAAASVLASKLGADSGLKVVMGDGSRDDAPTGKSNDMEVMQSRGLRNRKQPHTSSNTSGSTVPHQYDNGTLENHFEAGDGFMGSEQNPHNAEHHYPQGSTIHDGSWISRIAALLVGEDPTQSYALICSNCHMHNGLAKKEDLPYITYYCPHCNALNAPKHSEEHGFANSTDLVHLDASRTIDPEVTMDASTTIDPEVMMDASRTTETDVINDSGVSSVSDGGNSPVVAGGQEITDETETVKESS